MTLINFTEEELSKIECCILGDGDAYGDTVFENILDKIQKVYAEEEHIDLSLEENAEWDNPEVMEEDF